MIYFNQPFIYKDSGEARGCFTCTIVGHLLNTEVILFLNCDYGPAKPKRRDMTTSYEIDYVAQVYGILNPEGF